MYTVFVRKTAILIGLIFLVLPARSFAYEAPSEEYWQNFTLKLINDSRAEFNLPPVGIDEELNQLAKLHAQDTVMHYDDSTDESRRSTYLTHMSSDGGTLADRVEASGIIHAVRFGENVGLRYARPFADVHAGIQESLEYMHQYMMDELPPDDGHRQTILSDHFTHVGIWLELFRTPGENTNTLFLVSDFAQFTDGRDVMTPAVGSPPKTFIPDQNANEEETTTAQEPLRRLRAVPASRTRAVAPPANSPAQPTQAEEFSWTQKNTQRVAQRKSDRVNALLSRVAQRKAKRLMR